MRSTAASQKEQAIIVSFSNLFIEKTLLIFMNLCVVRTIHYGKSN